MPPKPLQPGDPSRLGRFELLGRRGEGGQGIVYLGRGPDPGDDRVAVKVLRSTADADVLERLARELDAIHQVQPFVTAGVIEASAEGERRYVVSEFIDGPSLQERVDERGPLPEGDLQRLAVGTATALTAIHGAGVVHRDFKPANVLLGPDGPRVVDFGIARLTDASTITSGLIGTPSYVAPEQLAGARPTSAVDIFAWAVTMIYAATGRLAFGADSVSAVMHRILYEEPDVNGLPPSLRSIARQCLEKDPARRPSARDLLLRLVDPSAQRAAAAVPAPAAAPGAGRPGRPAPARRRWATPCRRAGAPARHRAGAARLADLPRARPGRVSRAGRGTRPIPAWPGPGRLRGRGRRRHRPGRGAAGPGDHRLPPQRPRAAVRWTAASAARPPRRRRPRRPGPPPPDPRSRLRSRVPGKARPTMAAVGETSVALTNNVTFAFVARRAERPRD